MNCLNARVLLVEDDALISLDAEDMLLGLGARCVRLAHTLAEADALLAAETFDLAVLDIRVGASRSDALALKLVERGMPFIFTSGYNAGVELPGALQSVPTVGKPYTPETLRAALAAIA
jgi:CheY-like chemotaxis protein